MPEREKPPYRYMKLKKSFPKLKEAIMKKRRLPAWILCAAFVLALVGCTSTDVKSNVAGDYNLIPKIASKDFAALGIVSVSTIEMEIISPFHFTTEKSGEKITYDLFLQEARRLYPETSDIINVRIDRIDQNKKTFFDFLIGSTRIVKYIGNALAIKYTDSLEEVRDPLAGRNDILPTLSIRQE
jgi:hypothetical protein